MSKLVLTGAILSLTFALPAIAQTAPTVTPAAAVSVTPKGAVVAAKKLATPPGCMRLPLSDVAFGTENATAAARVKQQEYADAEARKRKWPVGKPMVKSNETVSCDVYLNLGPIGTEYRCLVTTTFCQK